MRVDEVEEAARLAALAEYLVLCGGDRGWVMLTARSAGGRLTFAFGEGCGGKDGVQRIAVGDVQVVRACGGDVSVGLRLERAQGYRCERTRHTASVGRGRSVSSVPCTWRTAQGAARACR